MMKLGTCIRILAIMLVVICFIGVFGDSINNILNPPKELSYSRTIQLVTDNQVEKVVLYSNKPEARIFLRDDDNEYVTNIPNEEFFCEQLQEEILSKDGLVINKESNNRDYLKIFYFLMGILFLFIAIFVKVTKKDSETSDSESVLESDLDSKTADFTDNCTKTPEVYFSDVAGLKEEKTELMEIIDFLKEPDKYIEMGAKIPKGVLLSGPPGTGKTLLAKAVATEANVSFMSVSASSFDEMYVGVGAYRVRQLFQEAKKNTPCIIFIDEIDAVGQKRANIENRADTQTIEQLLTEMDGFDTGNHVIVLAATNRLECLDSALIRPGRFDRIIEINLPDVEDRLEILKIHGKNKKFMDDLSFTTIAHNTAGFSGAELENLLNEAALIAIRNNQESISKENIDEALKKITIGLQKKGRKISDKEKLLTAYHEAGHAIISKFLSTQANVKEVSIIPRGTAGGYTLHETVEEQMYISKTALTEKLVCLLGGRAAEKIALKDISTGASNDLEVATKISKQMICVYGMNDEIGPVSLVDSYLLGEEMMDIVFKLITKSIKQAETDATKILTEHRSLLDIVANTLLEKETISGNELDEIIKTYQKNYTTSV